MSNINEQPLAQPETPPPTAARPAPARSRWVVPLVVGAASLLVGAAAGSAVTAVVIGAAQRADAAAMAEAAEQRLVGKGWLPAVLRTPEPEAEPVETENAEGIAQPSEAEAPDTGAQDGEAVEVEAVEQPTEPEAVDADPEPVDAEDAYSGAAE